MEDKKKDKDKKKNSDIKDVYKGKEITIWRDADKTGFVTIAIGLTTIAIDFDEWKDMKEDFKNITEGKRIAKK